MKLIIALSALAALVVAQDLNSLPDCGKTCVNNMLAKASELGCTPGDQKCYCTNPNFSNGLRDCSGQACGPTVQQQVLSFGRAYCASVTGGAATTTTAAGTTTTATTTTSSSGDAASSASSSASSALDSAKSSASSAVSSVASSLSSAVSSATSRASSAAGGATSSSSGSFAMKTQAPLAAAGVLGLAALLV